MPSGHTEDDNEVIYTWGETTNYPCAKAHFDIPWFESRVDFMRSKVTGAGFPFYVGEISRMVRALITFSWKKLKRTAMKVSPPIFVNAVSATATGQLPDKEGQMYFDQTKAIT